MKTLFISILLIVALSSCMSVGPGKDVYFLYQNQLGGIEPVYLPKGVFDMTKEERGYPIFHNEKDLVTHFKELMGKIYGER